LLATLTIFLAIGGAPAFALAPARAYAEKPPVLVFPPQEDPIGSNCYLYVKSIYDFLPLMADIQPNSPPVKGGVAIFYYNDKTTGEKVKHIAMEEDIRESSFTVSETNYEAGKYTTREISYNDPYWVGTYFPG